MNLKGNFLITKLGFQNLLNFAPNTAFWLELVVHTLCVCVCTMHQNGKLMMIQMQLSDLPTYHHCLARIMCNPPLPRCYLGECDACPGVTKLRDELIVLLEETDLDQIVYKQWTSTDRSTLETFCVHAEEFVEFFCEKLELLRPHSFIASQQASFYTTCKTSLQPGEFLVSMDFSENYTFILQDAA